MNTETSQILASLRSLASEERRPKLSRFFRTGKGGYGEGDMFLGVNVPDTRKVARKFLNISPDTMEELITSEWHEMRMCALMIMVEHCNMVRMTTWKYDHDYDESEEKRKKNYDFYLSHTAFVNNWDLVDFTAPIIVGEYLIFKPHDILYQLADSDSLWEQRIAIISTLAFIHRGDTTDTYALALKLLHHPHDLIQKAVGLMLREAGRRDIDKLRAFLDAHVDVMPRAMLRVAIVIFSNRERRYYLKQKFPSAKKLRQP